MFPLRSARDTDDVTRRQAYVIISNWRPSWIHRIGFRDFPETSESHPIDQEVNKNKRTLKSSNNMTPTFRKSFLFCDIRYVWRYIANPEKAQQN